MPLLHVLLAAGDTESRQVLAGALRAAGCQVLVTGDGPMAAEALAATPGMEGMGFDAIVVDLRLSGIDPVRLRDALAPEAPLPPESLDAAERRQIVLALAHTHGNKRQAAHLLGVARSTLLNKIRRYGII